MSMRSRSWVMASSSSRSGSTGPTWELQWQNGSPLDTPRDELTVVTEQQIQALLDEIRERFATPAARAVEAAKDREKPASEPAPRLPTASRRPARP